jgi:hypothetical protein
MNRGSLRAKVAMPDRCPPIAALSWSEVDAIAARFTSLNPYDLPGSILKVHKLNFDAKNKRRQLFGYGIAAKRYSLYTKTKKDIEIVDPKSHGLGYFYPPADSPESWQHEVPKWVFEGWDWTLRGELGLHRERPAWMDLPVMMRLTLSTPHHALRNISKTAITRPGNFMMLPQITRFGCPENVHPDNFTLITAFSSDRSSWMKSQCINIHDQESPTYELATEYDGRRAVPKTFSMLLDAYRAHPEAKSLGPNGNLCESNTRGLLQRAHIVTNSSPMDIGKESDTHWEEGDDLSLLDFRAVQYQRKGMIIASEEDIEKICQVPKRELMRRGINQHTLEKICNKEPVRTTLFAKCLRQLEELESEQPTAKKSLAI